MIYVGYISFLPVVGTVAEPGDRLISNLGRYPGRLAGTGGLGLELPPLELALTPLEEEPPVSARECEEEAEGSGTRR